MNEAFRVPPGPTVALLINVVTSPPFRTVTLTPLEGISGWPLGQPRK